jgi:hypothetical protein
VKHASHPHKELLELPQLAQLGRQPQKSVVVRVELLEL